MTELTKEDRIVRSILIDRASRGKTITYSELIPEAKLRLDMSSPYDRGVMGEILGRIVEYEHGLGRPMLSSVVLSKDGQQGDGFFKIAESLGYGSWKNLKKGLKFEFDQMNQTFEYWRKHKDI